MRLGRWERVLVRGWAEGKGKGKGKGEGEGEVGGYGLGVAPPNPNFEFPAHARPTSSIRATCGGSRGNEARVGGAGRS